MMPFGKCRFHGCDSPAGTCTEENGQPLLVCRKHYEYLSNLHTKDVIEEAFSVGSITDYSKEEGRNHVQVHRRSIEQN